ncbi:MAG: CHAT domain-containing protein [Bacteroidales bacterium]
MPISILKAQDRFIENTVNFKLYFEQGDFFNAEKSLLSILSQKDSIPKKSIIAISNNLGVINNRLGRYDKALSYYNLAEQLVVNGSFSKEDLGDIYINKARVYGIIKDYDKSTEFLYQGLKQYQNLQEGNRNLFFKISTGYLNLGLTLYEINDLKKALFYLQKSLELKKKYELSERALVYLNIAKIYVKVKDYKAAEVNFLLSIKWFNKEYGVDYYRTSSVLFDYGLFLRSVGRTQDALTIHQKALAICLKNYGSKHPFVSLAYKHIGDHYFNEANYSEALNYYQKSLTAVVNNFNDSSIYSNPSINSSIFDFGLLDDLKSKSKALMKLSFQQKDRREMLSIQKSANETIDLALQLIDRIRNDYSSYEGKLFLAENEKDTYLAAIQIAKELYNRTNKKEYIERMYSLSSLSKSRLLRDELNENEVLYSKNVPDSILIERNNLKSQISSYNKLIQDEFLKQKPDSSKVELWKDKLFELNRSNDLVYERIKKFSSQYIDLINRTEPATPQKLISCLGKDETIVEYFVPHTYSKERRELYIFTLSKEGINYKSIYLDSLFASNVNVIKQVAAEMDFSNSREFSIHYTDALAYMYRILVKPVEKYIVGSQFIIVPDEEIAYLPFDAFIKELPSNRNVGFDGLDYLIKDYSISYSYSSSFIFPQKTIYTNKVVSFSPSYANRNTNLRPDLKGAVIEVNSIRGFKSEYFANSLATEHNFKSALTSPAIFHLAMHSSTDTVNSKFSYLIFDSATDSVDDGRLYNYEISMSKVESPMVVLSACNTGTGNLYHGEGIMSLARSFFLSGVSSVVNTLWDVNDEASSPIITDFYRNLANGMEKNRAMRLAKLNYLKNATPTYSNPYYWSAYQVMGDVSPVKKNTNYFWIVGVTCILLLGGLAYKKLKR